MENQRAGRPNPTSRRRHESICRSASSGEPSENAIRGARLILIRCMQQPRLVQRIRKDRSGTVVLRDPGSTELGKQIIQLNGGPLTARGPQLDLLSRRWAAVNGWPAATARALAPGPPTAHQRPDHDRCRERPRSLSGPRPRHSRLGLMEAQRRRGRHEKVLRQAVIGMIAGAAWASTRILARHRPDLAWVGTTLSSELVRGRALGGLTDHARQSPQPPRGAGRFGRPTDGGQAVVVAARRCHSARASFLVRQRGNLTVPLVVVETPPSPQAGIGSRVVSNGF
jgi:hypothetical protein